MESLKIKSFAVHSREDADGLARGLRYLRAVAREGALVQPDPCAGIPLTSCPVVTLWVGARRGTGWGSVGTARCAWGYSGSLAWSNHSVTEN